MKRFKIALAALLVTGGIVAAFAFTSKSAHKTFSPTIYYYVSGTCNQFIPTNFTDPNDCRKSSLSQTPFTTVGDWTTTSNTSFSSDANNDYIAALEFNSELSSDGGSDGLLSKSEATSGVWNYYNTNHVLPAEGGTIAVDGVNVTIHRKLQVN